MSSCRVPPCPSVRGLHEASLCAFLVACGGLMPGRKTARLGMPSGLRWLMPRFKPEGYSSEGGHYESRPHHSQIV
jgi:hypothetical protein